MPMAIGKKWLVSAFKRGLTTPPNSDDPLVQYEFQEIKTALELDSTGESVAR